MIIPRPSAERGRASHGWLESRHSFSFADYRDPRHMGWGNLRVINDDVIAPGAGFPEHGHRDMEIVTYVLDGALAHKDSMGNVETIPPGEVQRMSAGSGVVHSEFNHAERPTRLLQIWILPERAGVAPSYEQRAIPAAAKRGRLALAASPDGAEGSVRLNADARLLVGLFDGAESARAAIAPGRKGYVHMARGSATVNGFRLSEGDALLLDDEPAVEVSGGSGAEILVFDLAGSPRAPR